MARHSESWAAGLALLVALAGVGSLNRQLDERYAAVHAARMAGGLADTQHVQQARAYFEQMGGTCNKPHFREFAQRWAARAQRHQTLEGRTPPGRPPKLPTKLICTIATDWSQKGVGTGDRWRAYLSMEEVRAGAGAARSQGGSSGGMVDVCRLGLPHRPLQQWVCHLRRQCRSTRSFRSWQRRESAPSI